MASGLCCDPATGCSVRAGAGGRLQTAAGRLHARRPVQIQQSVLPVEDGVHVRAAGGLGHSAPRGGAGKHACAGATSDSEPCPASTSAGWRALHATRPEGAGASGPTTATPSQNPNNIPALTLTLTLIPTVPAQVGSAFLLGLFWQQVGWLAHDVLHHQVFRHRWANNWAGLCLGNISQVRAPREHRHRRNGAILSFAYVSTQSSSGPCLPDMQRMRALATDTLTCMCSVPSLRMATVQMLCTPSRSCRCWGR